MERATAELKTQPVPLRPREHQANVIPEMQTIRFASMVNLIETRLMKDACNR
jgi:hypothetical protein